MTFGTVAILGPGLIGGSLALALTERGLTERLAICARSARALEEVRASSLTALLTTDPRKAVHGADIVVLCVPVETMGSLVREIAPCLKPGALVTDVGSVKESVEREVAPLLHGKALWLGSHPMAGSEKAGFAAARSDLFVQAAVVLTPTPKTAPGAEEKTRAFWTALGGHVLTASPAEHDQLVAEISHLPHLAAAALVNQASTAALELAAGGFRDTTRIASGSPELWAEILAANAPAVARQLHRLIRDLQALEEALQAPRTEAAKSLLLAALKTAQHTRSRLLDRSRTPLP